MDDLGSVLLVFRLSGEGKGVLGLSIGLGTLSVMCAKGRIRGTYESCRS